MDEIDSDNECENCKGNSEKRLSQEELQILQRFYFFMVNKMNKSTYNEILDQMAIATTFCKCLIENAIVNNFQQINIDNNSTLSKSKLNKNARKLVYDETIQEKLKNKINEYCKHGDKISVGRIHQLIVQEENFPKFSRSTLYRLMKDMGFAFIRNQNSKLLLEMNETTANIIHSENRIKSVKRKSITIDKEQEKKMKKD